MLKKKKDYTQIISARIKDGNLKMDQEVAVIGEKKPELKYIYDAFSTAIKDFKKSINKIIELSGIVNETADESTDISKSLIRINNAIAQGAEGQAEDTEISIEQLVHLSNEFEKMFVTTEIAENNVSTLSFMSQVGSKNVEKTIEKSNEMQDTFKQALVVVKELEESINYYDKIVATIRNISNQINMLSLNATIEAAKAGENGKGFAVVADEIRRLADQSIRAVQEIGDRVGTNRNKITTTIDIIDVLSEKSSDQLKATLDVSEAFRNIDDSVNSLVTQLSDLKQKVSGVRESKDLVIDSITNIAAVSQQSVASTEEAKSYSEMQKQTNEILFDLAEKLKATVDSVKHSVDGYQIDEEMVQRKKIGFVHSVSENHPYIQNMIKIGKETAKKYGYDFIINCPKIQSYEEQVKAVAQLEEEGIDYLIISVVDGVRFVPIIDRLHQKGIQTICIDADCPHSKRLYAISTNNVMAGINIGEVIVKLLKGSGQVVLSMVNDKQMNMVERLEGIYQVLNKYPDIHIVAKEAGYPDNEKRAVHLNEILMKHGQVDLVVGIEANFGDVINRLLSKKQYSKQRYIAFDNIKVNLDMVRDGVVEALIAQRQDIFTKMAVRKIYDYELGRHSEEQVLLDTYEINKTKVKSII